MTDTPQDPLGAPYQSSGCPAEHVARSDLMSRLQDALTTRPRETTTIVVLHGPHGSGKRAAAWHWATKSTSDYPGGQLHVDYGERPTRDRTATSDVLAECLRTLGTAPNRIPVSLKARAELFRAITADNPVLVVLNEVTDAAQVRELRPASPGSVVIVTSHAPLSELTQDGAQQIEVRPIPQPTSLELLRTKWGPQRVDSEPEAATQLADWCAGLPVALNVAAAALHARPDMPIAAMVSELVEEQRRCPDVPSDADPRLFAVFTVACAKLPEQAAVLYRRLGAAPVRTMTNDAVACIGRMDRTDARRLLEILCAARLIEAIPGGRFRLHEVIHPHARAHAAEHDQSAIDEVPRDLIQHYLDLAVLADRAIRSDRTYCWRAAIGANHQDDPALGSGGAARALDWFASERSALLAVTRTALDLQCDEQVWRLVTRMTWLYLHFGYADDWCEALDLGVRAVWRGTDWVLAWRKRVSSDLRRLDCYARFPDDVTWPRSDPLRCRDLATDVSDSQ